MPDASANALDIGSGRPARRRAAILLAACAAVLAVGAAHRGPAPALRLPSPGGLPYVSTAGLRLNQLQLTGTHNSYHVDSNATTLEWIDALAVAWDISLPSMPQQLDGGIRAFELDVFVDDEGGRFAQPLTLLGRTHDERFDPPGFKVLHVPDLDQNSICPTLAGCLQDMSAWSAAHPGHLPVMVMIECVEVRVPNIGPIDFADPAPWERRHVEELERMVRDTIGEDRLITPDLVRGESASVREAITGRGWPLVDEVRGRFMFVITCGIRCDEFLRSMHPGLRGSALFAIVGTDHPDTSFHVLNDPFADAKEIDSTAALGCIVRTRADENMAEALSGSTERRDRAHASGAQIVSTDCPAPAAHLGSRYSGRMPDGGTARVHPRAADPRAGKPILP